MIKFITTIDAFHEKHVAICPVCNTDLIIVTHQADRTFKESFQLKHATKIVIKASHGRSVVDPCDLVKEINRSYKLKFNIIDKYEYMSQIIEYSKTTEFKQIVKQLIIKNL